VNPPRIEVSAGPWVAFFRGTTTNHKNWGPEEADLKEDLDLGSELGHSFDLMLHFPRGPRFRLGIQNFLALGEVPEDRRAMAQPSPPADPGEPIGTRLDLFLLDLGFCPLIWEARWGSIFLETGLRYANSQVEVGTESGSSYTEGFLVTLSGEVRFPFFKKYLFGDAMLGFGFGPDSTSFEAGTGVNWRPHPVFRLRLGLRFLALHLVDHRWEQDKRDFSWKGGGPDLEISFKF